MHRRLHGVGYLLGLAGFILFFISDANDWKLSCRALKLCFPIGFALLAAGTARALCPARPCALGRSDLCGAASCAGDLHSLLCPVGKGGLHLPEAGTTGLQERRLRAVQASWRALVCGALPLPLGRSRTCAARGGFFSVLDVLLVLFEDRCVFPARLDGYDDYRAETPFLLPNRQSIRACCGRSKQRGA